jgi:hypothetical protein
MRAAFPNAQLETVADSYTFVPEDQPQRLTELVRAFMHDAAATRPTGTA